VALVRDISPGPASSDPHFLTPLGNSLFFLIDTNELWKTNGTSTILLSQRLWVSESSPPFLTLGKSITFFRLVPESRSSLSTPGVELMTTDVIPKRIFIIESSLAGIKSKRTLEFYVSNGTLALFGYSRLTSPASGLYVTDGTTLGTKNISSYTPFESSIYLPDSSRFLLATSSSIWVSEGSSASTFRIFDFASGASLVTGISTNDTAYFLLQVFGDLAADERRVLLYSTDGTSVGTRLIRSLRGLKVGFLGITTGTNTPIVIFSVIRRGLYRVFRTRGVVGDVSLLLISPREEIYSLDLPSPTLSNGDLLFGIRGSGLWKTDGTELGTTPVSPYVPLPGSQVITLDATTWYTCIVSGQLTICGTNGTSEGTKALSFGLLRGGEGSNCFRFHPDPDGIAFNSSNLNFVGLSGNSSVWSTDGTPSGTKSWKSWRSLGNSSDQVISFDNFPLGPYTLRPNITSGSLVRVNPLTGENIETLTSSLYFTTSSSSSPPSPVLGVLEDEVFFANSSAGLIIRSNGTRAGISRFVSFPGRDISTIGWCTLVSFLTALSIILVLFAP
jgi:hypothetical protein